MYIKEVKEALKFLMACDVVPYLWGPHGIGKTQAIKQFAAEGGHKEFTLALGNVEIPDILGVMDRKIDQYTGATQSSTYLMPEFFSDLIKFANENPDKYAILFLDELNHARKDVLSPIFQMITGKSIHTTKFPKNFRIIAASNPPTDDYAGVLNMRNKALLDRFCHINVQPSHKGWLEHATSAGVHADILEFVRENPEHLRTPSADFSADKYATPSERTWQDYVAPLYAMGAPKELIYGLVGTATGVAWYTWMEQQRAKTITGTDIMDYSKETEKRVKKLIKEGQWAEVQKAVDALQAEAAKRTKELHEAHEKGDKNDGKSPPDVTANIVKFLCELPDEVMVSAFLLLSTSECRYLAYTVFDDPTMVSHFGKVIGRTKTAEAGEATPAPKAKKK
jgi:MoxR-like ATPase